MNHYLEITRTSSISDRENLLREMEDYLLQEAYVRPLYKTDLIALIRASRINNYSEAKTSMFIPLTQHLHP
ncbi:MAG: hypothetical protein R3E95_20395 [Thiolinea sp.]